MRVLRIGDPHAKVNNLEEMRKLILFVIEQAEKHKVDRIEILGDLFHTHAILRLEVLDFWTWALNLLSSMCRTVVLVGNHDISGDYNFNTSALAVFGLAEKWNIDIVEKPFILGEFAYVPYMHDRSAFIASAMGAADKGAKVLVCHQSIQGSKFDNGNFDPEGVPTGEWSERFTHIISGHIHAEQEFGNIIYPGTPRWDTASDANRRKGIWIYDHEDGTGTITARNFISTEGVCSPIYDLKYTEGDASAPSWPAGARATVEIIGSSVWVAQKKAELKGKCNIKTKITDAVKKSDNRKTGKDFEDFMKNLFVTTMDRENLIKCAKELGIV